MNKPALAAVAVLLVLASGCGGDDDTTALSSPEKDVAASMATAITTEGGLLDAEDARCVAKAFVADRGLKALQKSQVIDADNEYRANGALADKASATAYAAAVLDCVDRDDARAALTKSSEAAYGERQQGILSTTDVHCLISSFVKAADVERLFATQFVTDAGEFNTEGTNFDRPTAQDFAEALTGCIDYTKIQAEDAADKNKKLSVTKLAACLRQSIPPAKLQATIVATLTADNDTEEVAEANAAAIACEKTSTK